ncbi:MAG: dihydroorotate dehydrogenase electron transfer subunit [Candidatus Omnitrophica bacterium]|nr:dihydroorotate dehydrogenase electron transfer subunit [Candidatus Omnitrophota bacterium]
MYDESVTIIENKKVNAEYYKLVFASKHLSQKVKPGQFLNIQMENHEGLLLRRPFSYYRVGGKKIEILYEILGRGTALLAEKRRGHALKALGPLGKPFTQKLNGKKRILVAGGVGVPPLIFLAETAPHLTSPRESRGREKEGLVLLIGCKSKSEVLPRRELTKVKGEILYSTNDGSYGRKGFVTVLLHELLENEHPNSLFIQTCGPNAMMDAVMKLAEEFGVEGEASIDERMACGVGACLGCVVETREGFKTSCVEGPVFSFAELV